MELQLLSTFSQKQAQVDLYVLDDFSTDRTLDIISKLSSAHRIKLFKCDSVFGSAGKSFIQLITSCTTVLALYDYVALADHDDIWVGDKPIKAISLLRASKSVCYSSAVTPMK